MQDFSNETTNDIIKNMKPFDIQQFLGFFIQFYIYSQIHEFSNKTTIAREIFKAI